MINILSLFSGIGAFESALDRIGCHYQLTGYCEIDPYASKSYAQIHGVSESLNLRDVTTIDTALINLLGGADLITYGFPCQDISVAGKQRGFTDENGNRTRSGLFFEALRVIKDLQPKYAIAENVKALTSKKFTEEFRTVLTELGAAGYNNYYAVLNSRDFGIPQQRERVFIISIRKDADAGGFAFPQSRALNLRLKDLLEPQVDEKYYLNTEKAKTLIKKLVAEHKITEAEPCDCTINNPDLKEISNAIIARYDCGVSNQKSWGMAVIEPRIKQLGNLLPDNRKFTNPQCGRVYDPEGLAPTLNTMQGGSREPKIIEPIIRRSIGRNPENPSDRTAGAPTEQRLEPNSQGISNTLTTVQKDNYVLSPEDGFRLRKLTPRECFRLMGFTDAEFDRIKGVSNTQLYKQAGNSIVVNVLAALFDKLLTAEERS